MTAGAALLTASAIAITPVVVTPTVQDIKVASPAVALTATVDPITRWLEVFNDSEVNFAGLANSWLEAPAPILQQVIANQLGYLRELPDIGAILEQMVTNASAAVAAPFATDLATLDEGDGLRRTIYDLMMDGLPPILPPFVPEGLKPLVEFTTTYLSGALIGLAGLVVNPVLALANGLGTAFDQMFGEERDLAAAINTLINIPADMVDSFLNGGQSINITPLLSLIGELPLPGMGADIVFGGLLSPGGTAFNSIAIDLGDGSGIPAAPAGLIGSLIAMSKVIAKALGWDGVGNPLAPPPAEEAERGAAADVSLLTAPTVTVDVPTEADAVTAEPASSSTEGSDPAPEPAPAAPVSDEESTAEETQEESASETETETEPVVDEDADPADDETVDEPAAEEPTDSDEDATESEDAGDTDTDTDTDTDSGGDE